MKNTPTDLISTDAAAMLLGINAVTLRVKRNRGQFPVKAYKMGDTQQSKVRYSKKDILEYIQSKEVKQTSFED